VLAHAVSDVLEHERVHERLERSERGVVFEHASGDRPALRCAVGTDDIRAEHGRQATVGGARLEHARCLPVGVDDVRADERGQPAGHVTLAGADAS